MVRFQSPTIVPVQSNAAVETSSCIVEICRLNLRFAWASACIRDVASYQSDELSYKTCDAVELAIALRLAARWPAGFEDLVVFSTRTNESAHCFVTLARAITDSRSSYAAIIRI